MTIQWRGAAALILMSLLAVACSTTSSVEATRSATAESEPTASPTEPTAASAASPTRTPTVEARPTAEPTIEPASTPEPTMTAEPTSTPEPTATLEPVLVAPGPCDAGPLRAPPAERPDYLVTMDIDPATGTVTGVIDVEFILDGDVNEVYFRLWPNGPRPDSGGVEMSMGEAAVFVGEAWSGPVNPIFDDPTIVRYELPVAAPAGTPILVSTDYELVVPAELNSRISGRADYMRLGTALPLLPWVPGQGWALDPATSLFAEAVVSPTANYSVSITVPDGYDVLASGVQDGTNWQVDAARDFAVSVGRFRTVTGVAMAPEPVQVTVGVHETINDDAQAYLDKVIDSLEQFSTRWAAYPWPSLTFALTPNLRGGIEFPTHIMQGPNTIGRTTSHEVGHMFFYSLVGNNQATAPWLDEGITSYAEFTYEGVGPGAYEIPSNGIGNATQPMTFWESQAEIYYRSVYGQTGFALQQLGTREDVDCALARYVAENAFRIATADDFVAAFEPTFPNVVEQLRAFGVDLEVPE